MELGSLLSILYPSIISLEIIYPTGYSISFRLVTKTIEVRLISSIYYYLLRLYTRRIT